MLLLQKALNMCMWIYRYSGITDIVFIFYHIFMVPGRAIIITLSPKNSTACVGQARYLVSSGLEVVA